MKRIVLSAFFLLQMLVVFAQESTSRVNAESVKMFRQAAENTEVMQVLTPADEIIVMRRHNPQWTLVQINGEAGYVKSSYLKAKKEKKTAAAKAERKLAAKR